MKTQQTEKQIEKQANEARVEALEIFEGAKGVVVRTPEDYESAIESIQEVKARAAALEGERKSAVDPLNAVIRKINGWFKPAIEALGGAERTLKGAAVAYQSALQAEQDRALAEAAEAAQAGDAAAVQAALQASDVPRPQIAGVSTKKAWKFEVVDAALVPREFLIPDEKAIGAYVRARKEAAQIPGVRTWAEDTLAVGKAS